jgi:hypothetical protein
MEHKKTLEVLNPLSDWYPKSDIVRLSGGKLSKNQIDWMVRNRDQNGLAPFVRKFCARFYVKWPEFGHHLIENQSG